MSVWAKVSGIFKYKNAEGMADLLRPFLAQGSEGSVEIFTDELRPNELCFSDNLRDFVFAEQWQLVRVLFDKCIEKTRPESAILQVLEADNFHMCMGTLWLDERGEIQEWVMDDGYVGLVNKNHAPIID